MPIEVGRHRRASGSTGGGQRRRRITMNRHCLEDPFRMFGDTRLIGARQRQEMTMETTTTRRALLKRSGAIGIGLTATGLLDGANLRVPESASAAQGDIGGRALGVARSDPRTGLVGIRF